MISLIASGLLLPALLGLSFWQTSLDFGDFRPDNATDTFVLWGVSTLVVIGTIALAFVVVRNLLKVYVERRENKLGSHIKTKLVVASLALSAAPLAVHVTYSIVLLNRNVDKWFSQPTVEVLRASEAVAAHANDVLLRRTQNDAAALAANPASASALAAGEASAELNRLARRIDAEYLALLPSGSRQPAVEIFQGGTVRGPANWRIPLSAADGRISGIDFDMVFAAAPIYAQDAAVGSALIAWSIPGEILRKQNLMQAQFIEWQKLEGERPLIWRSSAYKLALITLFVAFVAVWLALFASKQIIRPIEALVTATGEFAGGHLDYRVKTPAMDELAGLVEAFNKMGRTLEVQTDQLKRSNRELALANTELDARRRFIDAILESITPGVISVSDNGEILKFNESAAQIFAPRTVSRSADIRGLFPAADRQAFEHTLKRARRTGIANRDFEIERLGRILHLSVTVSSLESEAADHGFVVVFEDTTEIVRAQRSAAWQEVAQRLAHEIKNPLTPIALAAERIDRLLIRYSEALDADERNAVRKRLDQSIGAIAREVQSLKTLVNEFSDLARFPALRPEGADLNAVVRGAVGVFEGRLPGIKLRVDTTAELPDALIDPEPIKRVIVNLIDNAAEAVEGCWVKEIVVSTGAGLDTESVELVVADSGPGISPEDKQKLFLPYFSTKERGTGLGLPIISRIVADHRGSIRVEDNQPTGSRFIVELPTVGSRVPDSEGVAA